MKYKKTPTNAKHKMQEELIQIQKKKNKNSGIGWGAVVITSV
jgi:hypothetical protein